MSLTYAPALGKTSEQEDGDDNSYNIAIFKSNYTVGKIVLLPICNKLSIGSPFIVFHMCFFLYIININLDFDNNASIKLQ